MSIGTEVRNAIDVRFAEPNPKKPEESVSFPEPVIDWCQANSVRNAFDRNVLDYPSTKVLAAHTNGTVFAYMPVQGVAMLESIGPNPAVNPIQVAAAIVEMVQGACLMAYANGMRECYFLSSDVLTAEGAKKMGFEELPYKVYRKRLS